MNDVHHEQAYPGPPMAAQPIGFGFETSPYPSSAVVPAPAHPCPAYPDSTFSAPEVPYGFQAPTPPHAHSQSDPYGPGGPGPTFGGQVDQYSSTFQYSHPPYSASPETYQTQDYDEGKWRSGGGIPGGKAGVVGGAVAAGLGTALAVSLKLINRPF